MAKDTKHRILDAAQGEFSSLGFDGASIRDIAQKADVQIGAIRYHFGSKEDLFRAVFAQHAEDVLARRRVYSEEADKRGGKSDVNQLMEAILGPVLGVRYESPGGKAFAKLVANTVSNPDRRSTDLTAELFDPAAESFIAALQDVLPNLSPQDAAWGFFLSVGCLSMISSNGARLERLSQGKCSTDDRKQTTDALLTFVSGGIKALADRPK